MNTLLLVDDDLGIRQVVTHYALSKGYRVVQATTGLEGLEAYRACDGQGITHILTDVEMPEMNGTEMVQWIRREYPTHNPRVVFMTGGNARIQLANYDIILKPFRLQTIDEVLR